MTNHPNRSLRAMMAVPTYRNTKFTPWWEMLNAELAKLGLPEATFGPAHDAYEFGEAPSTAAASIAAMAEA